MDRRSFLKMASGACAVTASAGRLFAIAGPVDAAGRIYQWRPMELQLASRRHYERPWSQVDISADFKGPAGQLLRVNGFWDGAAVWRVRFTPPAPGEWSYRLNCNTSDPAFTGVTGKFNALPAAGEYPLHRHGGILRVAPDGHYLTYSDGTPFFWLGDTWWFCPSRLVPFDHSDHAGIPSMYKALIDKRRSEGFSVVQMAFLGSLGRHQDMASFMSLETGGVFDMSYWRKVDAYINYANAAGIIPAIALGWHYDLNKHPLAEWKFLWRYVIARYGASSVTWLITGEYNAPDSPVPKALALGAFIRVCDPYQRAMSMHPWWYAGDKRQAWPQPWYSFIMFQGAHEGPSGTVPPTANYHQGWKFDKPVVEGEARYEHLRQFTADDVRRTAWHAMQAGCCGYTYGANGLWYPTQNAHDHKFWKDWGRSLPWWKAMNYPGAVQMGYMKTFYESMDWWRTVPRWNSLETSMKLDDSLQPLVRSWRDDLHVVWFPQGLAVDVKVSLKLIDGSGKFAYRGKWFNPRTGRYLKGALALSSQAGVSYLPPRADAMDWVLLLQRAKGRR